MVSFFEIKMNIRKFIKKSLEGIVIAVCICCIPLISGCKKNPVESEPDSILNINSIIKDNIKYYIETDKKIYSLRENVEMLYRVTNVGKEPRNFTFSCSQWYDFNVKKSDEEIWRWSYDKFFAQAITNFGLNPDEYKEFIQNWNMTYNNGNKIMPGNYFISGKLVGPFRSYSLISVPIKIIQ